MNVEQKQERKQKMRKIIKPSGVPNEILHDYDFFIDVRDGFGRFWKLAAFPRHRGSVAYFPSLSVMRNWIRDVEEIRAMEDGRITQRERLFAITFSEHPFDQKMAWQLLERRSK